MERDPVRFAWRAAPALNAALIALVLLVGLPCLWVALDLVRVAVDAAGVGRAAPDTPFLRVVVKLPDRIRALPVVILPGYTLSGASLAKAIAGGLAGVVVAATLLWWLVGTLGAQIGRRVAGAMTARLIEGIASAPMAAAEEARHAASLAGDALVRERRAVGLVSATPAIFGAAVAFAAIYVAAQSLEMGLVLLIGLYGSSLIARREMRHAAALVAADRAASTTLQRSLSDLADHLSAVAAHGTRGSEHGRIAADLTELQAPVERLERQVSVGSAAALATLLLGPFGVLAAAGGFVLPGALSPGAIASATLAAATAVAALLGHLAWRRTIDRMKPLFGEIARTLGSFQSRRRTDRSADLPASGALVAAELATGATASGRLIHVDLDLRLPGHIALHGEREAGARTFASLIGGQLSPSAGRLTFGGVDLADAEPGARARRLAFAGGETYLFPSSLRANLLYGTSESDVTGLDDRLARALTVAGLDELVERRGLSGSIDSRREPKLAQAITAGRREIRAKLEARGLSGLVEPFDPGRYNLQATIGENILFGVALGDTFREDRLPSQPFMKSLLDAEGLAKPLAAIGAAIARSTLEMFADIPTRPSLVNRFALIGPAEREDFERILAARDAGRRGASGSRDAEKLVGLALRYCEPRHRLGLLGPDLRERLIALRAGFADKMPKSLDPAVEFFDPDRVCAAASVRDNLLFGRIAHDRAEAEREVLGVVRAVLAEIGLAAEVSRVGLGTRVDPLDPSMTEAEIAAVDLVRCLVREPDNVVVEHALEHLSEPDAVGLVRRMTAALPGRGLLIVVPDAHAGAVTKLIGRGVWFEAGRVVGDPFETESEAIEARITG